MSCVLRVSSELPVEPILDKLKLQADRTWRKGESRPIRDEAHTDFGFSIVVSEADFGAFESQIADAVTFLKLHLVPLQEISQVDGICLSIDFGVAGSANSGEFYRLSAELVALIAAVGAEIQISRYEVSD